jgi:hypothetical protein
LVNEVEAEFLVELPALVGVGVLEQPDDAADALDQVAELVFAEWGIDTVTVRLDHRPGGGKLGLDGP